MARLLLRDLTPGTAYKIQLRAADGDSFSEWSRRFDLLTTTDSIAPDVPAWAVTNPWVVNGDTFIATWQDINKTLAQNVDFDHYELELDNTVKQTVVRTTNTSYTLTFDQNRIYFGTAQATVKARVRSVDAVGNASAWSTQLNATNPAPNAPASITVSSLVDSIKVDWAPASTPDIDLIGYKVQVSTTSSSTGFSDVYNGPDLSYTHSTILYLTDHWFRVYAVDEFGSLSSPVTSGAVRPKSVFTVDSTPPATPASLTATGGFDTTTQQSYLDLSWASVADSDLDSYVIRYGKNGSNWEYISVPRELTSYRLLVDAGAPYYVAVTARDLSGNLQTTYRNASVYPVTSTADTSAPSTPTAPTAVGNTLQVQVTIPGTKAAGGAMESDVSHYEVHGSTTTGFTPSATTMFGTVPAVATLVGTFDIPASGGSATQSWFLKIIAVDRSGNKSTASAQTTVGVGLIAATNIIDATITSAKIVSLNADKIVAGSGIINSLSVLNTLTIGGAATAGAVQSFDWVSNSTGWKISTNASGQSSFEVNQGTIKAQALLLQSGQNLMPMEYADFEANTTFYTTGGTYPGLVVNRGTATVSGSAFKFNSQALNFVPNNTTNRIVLASSLTDYNIINIQPSKSYIVSYYAMIPTGSTAATIGTRLFYKGDVNLLTTNPDFESGTTGWTPTGGGMTFTTDDQVGPINGIFNAQVVGTTTGGDTYLLSSTIPCSPSTQYTVSAWRRVVSITGAPIGNRSIWVQDNTGTSNSTVTLTTGVTLGTWVKESVTLTTSGTAASFTVRLYVPNGTIRWDNVQVQAGASTNDPGFVSFNSTSVPANSVWNRYSGVLTTPANATGGAAQLHFTSTAATTIWIDAIQIEEQLTSLTTPSSWTPPGETSLTGDLIRTGSLISSLTTTVNGNTIPFWNINRDGSASFANLQVRGNAIVGVSNAEDGGASQISSGNYVAGNTGWVVRSDGYAEFRNLASDSISGDSIIGATLTIDKIGGGSTNQVINLVTGSSILATGLMGEEVGMGAYGFSAYGPQENPITFRQSGTGGIASTTRTITTQNSHTFAVGDKINIVMGTANTDYDGTYTVASVISSTQLTYIGPTSILEASTAATAGSILQGLNTTAAYPLGPVYINFPTDGTQPNIISGQLTASQVVVTDGMSIRKASQIEQGAALTINSVIQPPKSAPVASINYSDQKITGALPSNATVIDAVRAGSGNYFILYQLTSDDTRYSVAEVTGTGSLVATRVNQRQIAQTSGFSNPQNPKASGIAYQPSIAGGRFYVAAFGNITRNNFSTIQVDTFSTAWAFISNVTILPPDNAVGAWKGYFSALGWDFTNGRLLIAYGNNGSGSSNNCKVDTWSIDVSTGAPSAQVGGTVTLSGVSTTSDFAFIGRGDFDFGASTDRFVFSDVSGSHNWQVFTNAGATDSTRNWPQAYASSTKGGWWDTTTSKFNAVNSTGTKIVYEGGDSFWLTTATTDTRWVRYSYRKSTVTVAETTPSPAVKVTLPKRGKINVTITSIPGAGGGNVPDSANVYLLDADIDAYPTVTNYYLRTIVSYGSTVAAIDPYTITTTTIPVTTNGFASLSGNPGMIQSSTGNSFWKGDDTAQFYQLILQSSTDVTTNSGNTPALRIGNILGAHLRLDGNEIQAMNSNTTGDTGTLILQQGGGQLNVGGQLQVDNALGIQSSAGTLHLKVTVNSCDVQIQGDTNIAARITTSAGGTALTFRTTFVAATTSGMNATTPTSGNTMPFHANDIHSWANGIFMEDLNGGGSTGATIGNGGRITRTSSSTMKESIKPMTDEEAYSVLGMESYTFKFKQDSKESPNDPRRYPGFIAEQAAEAGAELWVGRQHDVIRDKEGNVLEVRRNKQGPIIYFRTGEVTVAHNHIIKHHEEKIAALEAEVARLAALVG